METLSMSKFATRADFLEAKVRQLEQRCTELCIELCEAPNFARELMLASMLSQALDSMNPHTEPWHPNAKAAFVKAAQALLATGTSAQPEVRAE